MSETTSQQTLALPSVRDVAGLRQAVQGQRRVALVPTMGALHQGHLSLVRLARERADQVIVSIFVNPMQFGEDEDLAAYPRDVVKDAEAAAQAGADLLYLPSLDVMYPHGFATTIKVRGVTAGLCGDDRPGHFEGVTTVVAKLFLQCRPHLAVFGEKDYQQLAAIRRMVRDLDFPVEIAAGPIVREPDGLALSSRNVYLSEAERRTAAHLPQILSGTGQAIAGANVPVEVALKQGRTAMRSAGIDRVDYLELCDAETLEPTANLERPARLLAAVRIGATRLIDNIPVVSL